MSNSHDGPTVSWAEEERAELNVGRVVSTKRRLAGVAAIATGTTLLSLKHRQSITEAGGQLARGDVLGAGLLAVGGLCLAPLAIPNSLPLYTPRAPTHRNTPSNIDKKEFEFKILNGRWDSEADRMEKQFGSRPFWFPKRIRDLLEKSQKEEAKKRRMELLEKERKLEEEITNDLLENKMTTRQILQKLSKRVYLVDFADYDYAIPRSDQIGSTKPNHPDSTVEWVSFFRSVVSFLITVANQFDEIVVRLSSPGGSVSEYGLAASQVLRLRRAGLKVTVCVDTVAASGGYMMACCANKIVAAPFALLGSIGVVAELPNFHRVLDHYEVDYLLFTAGEFKRTVHHLAENTAEGLEKFQEQLEDIHDAFKSHVETNRKQVDTKAVGTGEAWLATQAKTKGLVDELMTSDEYLHQLEHEGFDIVNIRLQEKKSSLSLPSILWDILDLKSYFARLKQSASAIKATIPFHPQQLLAKL